MSQRRPKGFPEPAATATVRCAIYTRKSTDEGLDKDFNSLDAQREAGEAYVASQRHAGWVLLPHRYDDGGFTGGNTDRPALQRLLTDIDAGRVDCVVVYKVDRLSRSLLDFAKLIARFDERQVAFVSVTQQFNTANSMGRLMLNVLLSFAQFEREVIAERTRDKMAAMRKKGKWLGGLPPLGYDVDPASNRLVVNAPEADRVRAIFALYQEHGSLLPVVEALRERGWATKSTTTKKGTTRGGKPFDRTNLYRLLTSEVYVGRVRYGGESYAGEHAALIDEAVFAEVQHGLRHNGRTGGATVRNASGSILQGLLRCRPCHCAMTPTHTSKGPKKYRYYVCSAAQKNGRGTCPSKSVPAGSIEQYVIDRIRVIGRDPALAAEVVAQARAASEASLTELAKESQRLHADLSEWRAGVKALTPQLGEAAPTDPAVAQFADLQERLAAAEARLAAIGHEQQVLQGQQISESAARQALSQFDSLWAALTPKEQANLIALLVDRVEYDGEAGTVAITFHPSGIRALAAEADRKRSRS